MTFGHVLQRNASSLIAGMQLFEAGKQKANMPDYR
jgi:hypothetical protein